VIILLMSYSLLLLILIRVEDIKESMALLELHY